MGAITKLAMSRNYKYAFIIATCKKISKFRNDALFIIKNVSHEIAKAKCKT